MCSWPVTGLKTLSVDNVLDEDHKEKTIELFQNARGLCTFDIPHGDVNSDMVFMLGVEANDEALNGPVIVTRDLEEIRNHVNAVRALLGLGNLHLDCKLHMSLCRLTGKQADGAKDHQALRALLAPQWPKLGNGYPDIVKTLLLPKKRKSGEQADDESTSITAGSHGGFSKKHQKTG